ncbi:alpha/beta hydrolase [Erythrobacter sp. HA6-11]
MIWILAALAVFGVAAFIALQVAIARNGPAVLDTVDRLTAGQNGTERLATVSYGSHPAQKLVVLREKGIASEAALPVLIFKHGGSWKDGDPEDYGFVGRSFAPHGFITVLAGYRLGEDGRFPAMLEDGAESLGWVHANIAKLGGDPDRIFLMGHSAGAYNVSMLALDPRWLENRSVPHSAIKGVIGLAGPYDFYPFDSDSTRATFGSFDNPEATQPINFAADPAPPFLLIHGEQDTTVKPRNSRALAEQLQQADIAVELVTFSEMDHTAPLLHLASPWRRTPDLHEKVRQFLANPPTSVPVQGETR